MTKLVFWRAQQRNSIIHRCKFVGSIFGSTSSERGDIVIYRHQSVTMFSDNAFNINSLAINVEGYDTRLQWGQALLLGADAHHA